MPVRSGKQFIEDLRKRPREVWLRGERVHDGTTPPAFKLMRKTILPLYAEKLSRAETRSL